MSDLIRFGVSVESSLLERFDAYIREHQYRNRSEALRDLMRESLVEDAWVQDEVIAGGIAYVYDHHSRQLVNQLLAIQHDYHDLVVSSQHIHLDHDNCLEIVVVKGHASRVSELYNGIRAMKGIQNIDILKTAAGESKSHPHK